MDDKIGNSYAHLLYFFAFFAFENSQNANSELLVENAAIEIT